MRKVIFIILLFVIISLSLSMNCFTTGAKRTDFSYNPDKANADLISKTNLSSFIDDCSKAGIDYKDNKLYLAYGKDILQFDSNSLVFEITHNIFLDVTYDYNITSITHDDNYFYILANEYDQTGDVIKQYILKESTVGNTIETYYYFTTNNNRVVRIKYDLDNSMFLSLYLVSTYYYGNDDYILTKYFLYYLKFNNNIIDLSRVGIDYNLDRKCIQSFCYNNNNILPSFWVSRVMTIPQSGNLNSPPPSGRYPEVIFSAN